MIPLRRLDGSRLDSLPPLSLYVHLPWCLKKCPYCDFNSHAVPVNTDGSGATKAPEADYIDALLKDLESALPGIWGRRIQSIFMGGGTPSLFSASSIDRLLAEIRARMNLAPAAEITLEANPGTFEKDRFKGFRDAGVNRLSIGVQSFDDQQLKRLGRVHSSQQAMAAIDEARTCFDTFNIDLMYALPGQSLSALQRDLDTALSFAPPHLSLYHLTIEPNTVFASDTPADLPDDDTVSDMMDLLLDRTREAGVHRYEISAYARAGHQCMHNLNYWQYGDYLGIGAGAHSKLSFHDRIERQIRWREPATYMRQAMQGQPVSNTQLVEPDARPFEFMLNALRLVDGVTTQDFTERTGLSLHRIQRQLDLAQARELLVVDHQRIRPTSRGLDFLSDLQAIFLP